MRNFKKLMEKIGAREFTLQSSYLVRAYWTASVVENIDGFKTNIIHETGSTPEEAINKLLKKLT
jgi:hypothetical protein